MLLIPAFTADEGQGRETQEPLRPGRLLVGAEVVCLLAGVRASQAMYLEIQYHPSYCADRTGQFANNKVMFIPTATFTC